MSKREVVLVVATFLTTFLLLTYGPKASVIPGQWRAPNTSRDTKVSLVKKGCSEGAGVATVLTTLDDAAPLMDEFGDNFFGDDGKGGLTYMTKNVLITGFLPFGNATVNPAAETAKLLDGVCKRIYLYKRAPIRLCYEGWTLPVDFNGSRLVADELLKNPTRWDGIIHLGYESSAKGLKLEIAAANVMASEGEYGATPNVEVPCNKKNSHFADIVKGGPCVLPTTAAVSHFDLSDITSLLQVHGLASLVTMYHESWSRDAGSYFCNDCYYSTLHQIRSLGRAHMLPAMFIHLPSIERMPTHVSQQLIEYCTQAMMMGSI